MGTHATLPTVQLLLLLLLGLCTGAPLVDSLFHGRRPPPRMRSRVAALEKAVLERGRPRPFTEPASPFSPGSAPECVARGNCTTVDFANGGSGFALLADELLSGIAVHGAGDFNGDGIADVIVGSPFALNASGAAFIVFGSREAGHWKNGQLWLNSLADGVRGVAIAGNPTPFDCDSSFLGFSVSAAGDMNGDGIGDVIIGAPDAYDYNGAAYVCFGTRNTSFFGKGIIRVKDFVDGVHGFELIGESSHQDWVGIVVRNLGDVNGDGLSDVAITAPDSGQYSGNTYVVFGSAEQGHWGNGKLHVEDFIDGKRGFVLKGANRDLSGEAVGAADINGDGINDIIIGEPYWGNESGMITVIFGAKNDSKWGNGTTTLAQFRNGKDGFGVIGATYEYTGESVSSAGDINRDGIADLIVGATGYSNFKGRSYVVFGTRDQSAWGTGHLYFHDLSDGVRGFALSGETTDDWSGGTVSGAGDVNGDGIDDLISGAVLYGPDGNGSVYVVYGSSNTSAWGDGKLSLRHFCDGVHGFIVRGPEAVMAGSDLGGAGDINGDGVADFIFGAPIASIWSLFGWHVGSIYVVFGFHR